MFKLLELEFIGHPFLGSLAINFVKEGEEQAEFYSTLIIGPNGSGKSQVMLAVISIFNSLKGLSIGNKYKLEFQYKLRYISDSQRYYIE